jgi:putative transposase
VPKGLHRWYERYHLHFITFSCYRRLALLDSSERRDELLIHIEDARKKHGFAVLGYVVMPEHLHLLVAPPASGDPSLGIKSLKLRSSRGFRKSSDRLDLPHFWQPRFYDFNVYSDYKRVEKLRCMHRNPVARGLVTRPEDWKFEPFSSHASSNSRCAPSGLSVHPHNPKAGLCGAPVECGVLRM